MKRFIVLLASVLVVVSLSAAENNPVADAKAMVVVEKARFTVLTPQLIRMEWSEDGRFEDNATLTFVNRALPVPEFKVLKNRKSVVIKTDYVTLTYKRTGKFTPDNLSAVITMGDKRVVWHYGDADTLNLMGTTRTLDGADGAKLRKKDPMEQGILSRGGWSVVDDSQRHLLVPVKSHWKHWVECRPEGDRQDLYLFGYGHDYTKALSDYTKIAGRIPLPPKYAFGYWWSRYWQYSDNELRDLVGVMKSLDIPIDVLIVDMDWHETWGLRKSKDTARDEYGQRVGWTGYTWKKQLFPSPKNFLSWCHSEKLKVSLNLHPASGIQPYEEPYERFVKAYDWKDKGKSVPFYIDEQKWADAYFDTVLGPMEKEGVDFWWLDWQQWKESKFTEGLSNTFWLNHTFAHHMGELGNNRPFIYHRWGGLGSHRYQVGFSGDTYISWETLAFLPWFTATASNVGYGYWGHDIGGHMFRKGESTVDPELYLRWLQYGVFTPIFKTHCTKNRLIERRVWMFPNHMLDMRAAIRLRYTLAPYIYNAARTTYDTGVSMCRPMYYAYAECDEAYDFKEQFMFGDDILVAPVVAPIDKATGVAERKVWFPEGRWFDMVSGQMYEGNRVETLYYTLSENPYFVKAGAIIPMNPSNVDNLQDETGALVLTVIPGGEGELRHYEDDGASRDYDKQYAVTRITNCKKGSSICLTISAREGSYVGAAECRAYELRFPAQLPPKQVKVNGKALDYSRFGGADTWTYDGYTLAPIVYLAERECGKECVVELVYDAEQMAAQPRLYGKQCVFNRCLTLTPEFKEVYAQYYDPYPLLPDAYMNVSQAPNFILEEPSKVLEYIDLYEQSLGKCIPALEALKVLPAEFIERMRTQLLQK